jgi:hypothetical protein
LRAGRAVDASEGKAAQRIWRRWRFSLHHDSPPPLVSDGLGGHRDALLQVFGNAPPRGQRRAPQAGWHYLQVIKLHDDFRRVKALRSKLVWGKLAQQQQPLPAQTAYVERTHLTSRRMNARLARRGLCASKSLSLLWASLYWCDALYNLVHPVHSLRQASDHPGRRWTPRSPAMAAGLTDHLWSVRELLYTIPLLTNSS